MPSPHGAEPLEGVATDPTPLPALYLTFDDGPGPEGTRRVLEALATGDALATFFLLGTRVREHPELVGAIRDAGHRVELHGDAHLDHRTVEACTLAADTTAAIDAVRASGVEPGWWRLPWGRPGPATAAIAEAHRLRIVGWDVDTHDWRGDGAAHQPTGFSAAAHRGGVVLMHDGFGPGATRSSIENTVALVAAITREAGQAGTRIVPLPDPAAPAADGVPDAAAPEASHAERMAGAAPPDASTVRAWGATTTAGSTA